ncbi:MAG: CoA transferase [Deltaproteobacteria bacterium]|nr:CoA transferase [Deltaproteobacteria bacterium]MBI3388684.1 CoA transferase [Deltaproteobacteria bacterium]
MPPIKGLKLLDLSRQLPGPFASMMLADLGVDVLVIAAPNDVMGVGIPMIQRNKRSMTLNLKSPEGKEIFNRLAKDADIILEGFRPGVTDRLGIDYATMAKINPRLVYCSISGYGQDGPYRNKVGHDINYLGYAGVLGVSGPPDGPPVSAGVQIADIGGGAQMAVIGMLAALLARDHTGRGQFVDVSMMDGAVTWNVFHILMHLVSGQQPQRSKTRLTGHHPCYAIYETKDGKYVTVGALEEHFWKNLCVALGVDEFIPDEFAEGARREEMFRVIRAKFKSKTQKEWLDILDPIDICFGPVSDIAEVFEDPQVKHRGLLPVVEGQRALGSPLKFSDTPPRTPSLPPDFGQHTGEVLQQLGFGDADIERLRSTRVI